MPWALAESLFSAVNGLLSTLIVGFFLKPIEVGEAGAALAVVALVEIGCAFGIGEAVVRSRSIHTSVTDSAYAGLLGLSLAGSALCCALAPLLGALFDDRQVELLLLAGSVLLPLSAIDIVPVAILTRKMRIATLVKRGLLTRAATLLASGGLAWRGWGAWSVMVSTMVGSALASLTLLGAVTRWPRLRFNWTELRALMRFGGLVSLESLLLTATTRVYGLLFGIFHGVSALGYLQFAQRLIDEIANLIQGFALRFGLSFFAGLERAGKDSVAAFETGTKLITIVAAPVLVGFALVFRDGLAVVGEPRWLPSSLFVAVAAVSWTLTFPMLLIGPLLRARGEQKSLVAYSTASCLLTLAGCVATAGNDLTTAALTWGFRHYLAIPASVVMVGRFLGMSWRRFAATFARPFLCTAVMAFAVAGTGSAFTEPGRRFLAQIGIGALTYVTTLLVVESTFLRSMLAARRPGSSAAG